MNKFFLYKKAYPIGFIDDSDNATDMSWFADNSQYIFEKKLSESSIDELIIELIDIFKRGNPNYRTLTYLLINSLDQENFEEYIEGNTIIKKYNNINGKNKSIVNIEIHLEEMNNRMLIIRNLYLCFTNLPPKEVLKNKINEVYDDVYYQESEDLMISERDSNIIILDSNKPSFL